MPGDQLARDGERFAGVWELVRPIRSPMSRSPPTCDGLKLFDDRQAIKRMLRPAVSGHVEAGPEIVIEGGGPVVEKVSNNLAGLGFEERGQEKVCHRDRD